MTLKQNLKVDHTQRLDLQQQMVDLLTKYKDLQNETDTLKTTNEKQAVLNEALQNTVSFLKSQNQAQEISIKASEDTTFSLITSVVNRVLEIQNTTSVIPSQLNSLEVRTNVSNTELLNNLEDYEIITKQTLTALQYVSKDDFDNQQNMLLNLTKFVETESLKMRVTSRKHQQYIDTIADQLTADNARLRACISPRVVFSATFQKATGTISIKRYTTVKYNLTLYNAGGAYNVTTGRFTCKEPGMYSFTVRMKSYLGRYSCLALLYNGALVTELVANDQDDDDTASMGVTLALGRGDHVEVEVTCGSTLKQGGYSQANMFTGHLVHGDACL